MAKHKWGTWQKLVLNGRIRKGIEFPRRERLMVRNALQRMGIRFKEIIPVRNPYWRGWKDKEDNAIQWLDFVVLIPHGLLVLLFYPGYAGGVKPHERRAFEVKLRFLEERGTPYLILSRRDTSQIYEAKIARALGKGVAHDPEVR